MTMVTPHLLLCAGLAFGSGAEPPPDQTSPPVPMVETAAAAQSAPSVTMRMLLEVTIFRIDVLTLELRIDEPAADSIRSLARSRERTEAMEDSVSDLAADATGAYARLDFLRDISLDRFLDAVQDNAVRAAEADYITSETADFIAASLPEWYAFLEDRGIEEGDRMEYFIRGDTLTVHYRSASDSVLMDQTDVGPERRRSVLGGYFAPGSDFREGLLDSLYRRFDETPDGP